MNELKDIRDKFRSFMIIKGGKTAFIDEDVIDIQSETYTLAYNKGRDEVIEEMEEYRLWAETYYGFDLPISFLKDFTSKLNQLKEKK